RRRPSAQERAREDGLRVLAGEARAELSGRIPARGRQRSQVVGVAGSRLGVADEEQAHGPEATRLAAMRSFRYVVCDVFTDVPLAGNQLAVFTDARDLDPLTMQALARETNFSETVFVLPPSDATADVRIRIFTPALELPFAGHPTLGTAFVLGGPLSKIVVRLETGAGVIPVELERDGPRIVFGLMEQPIPTWEPVPDPGPILAAAGVSGSQLPIERYDLGPGHVYIEHGSPGEVAALAPDVRGA